MLILYSEDPLKSEIGFMYCFMLAIKVSKDVSMLFPIICLEGVAIEDVVKYYAGIKAHEEAIMDRAIEDYDFNKLYQEQ